MRPKPRPLDAYTRKTCTITAVNPDYGDVLKWSDGNPNNEDRIGYFVSIDSVDNSGINMVKSTSESVVRGVTVESPGFSSNAIVDYFDDKCELLDPYEYVAFTGFVYVITDGSILDRGVRCMPNDEGIATLSSSDMGYLVIDVISSSKALILIDPQGDVIKRMLDRIIYLENQYQPRITFGTEEPSGGKHGDVYIQLIE